ncbi:MAG: EAL domain-containing protein [Chromatiaceae bacterium]|nr:EAL domain-containing protein [Chromatiaceae bacterium]MBP6807782.1 EAL domain-containing protein [Chromatiaceae bacterium]MBP8283434.1 EAL domain-containing protein [Chromatiaceae bacterium]MBP8289994.1 EAL domain-containing protein [Chromatiaceae bacterium]MBP9604896.1 EAL domain-containing protein [Chromatiaceae bacterium]
MNPPRTESVWRQFLSLRWQALFALSLVLLVINGTQAVMAYRYSRAQFELQQSGIRGNQVRQLRGLLTHSFEDMTRLVKLLSLLGTEEGALAKHDLGERLASGLTGEGTLLGLEWDPQSIYWLTSSGGQTLVWPSEASALGADLIAELTRKDDSLIQVLACRSECLQFLAAPILWRGQLAGTLVVGRSLADTLLAFNLLTGAEVAVFAATEDPVAGMGPLRFPAITHPSLTEPIIRALAPDLVAVPKPILVPANSLDHPVLGEWRGQWFEIFRVDDLVPGVSALVVNEVTAENQVIQAVTRNSILLGFIGLVTPLILLFWLVKFSVGRLRRIATALPLLAENRYAELRESLPAIGGRLTPEDELDQLSETTQTLTDRMELLQLDREEAERRLVWLADHDPLTQLYNRRRFREDFERILDQARRYEHTGAVLFLDLDQFKDVNDLSGHLVGDVMLQRVAEQLIRLIRPSDTLARVGGDEFALILPESRAVDAQACAQRIQAAVRSIQVRDRERIHRVTVSIGIALFPDQGQDPQELLANADIAMFQAKGKGAGRLHLFSLDDRAREQMDARITWRDKIAEGLRDDRFVLHFQPIVTISTGSIHHWEVLLRLRDRRGKLACPDRFIPVAEKTGQIQAIDHWVLAHAIQCLGRDSCLRLGINLSGRAMDDPALLPDIERLLGEHRVEPTRLTFEVTETAAVSSLVRATELMKAVQRLGCGFALDDFGTGYASYAYLRRLPVDEVKIDGAFIRDLAKNQEDRIFVKAITDMAHGMGKRVTAEYVETEAIYEILGELGVDYAQGYFLGRPKPEAEQGPWPRAGARDEGSR